MASVTLSVASGGSGGFKTAARLVVSYEAGNGSITITGLAGYRTDGTRSYQAAAKTVSIDIGGSAQNSSLSHYIDFKANSSSVDWGASQVSRSGISGNQTVTISLTSFTVQSNVKFSTTINAGSAKDPAPYDVSINPIASGSTSINLQRAWQRATYCQYNIQNWGWIAEDTSYSNGVHVSGNSVTGLTRYTTYSCQVRFGNGNSDLTYSNTANCTTNPTNPTLSAITISDVNHNSAKASFSVTDNGGKAITSNKIELSETNFGTVIKTITGTSGTFSGLTPGKTYYARAYATNGITSNYSAVKSFTTTNPVPSNLKITNLKSYYKNKTADICISGTVSATSVTTITNYTLYYKRSIDSTYTSKSLGTGTTFELTNLQNNTTYNIYFTVKNSGGTATSSTYNQATLQMYCIKISQNGAAFVTKRMYYSLSGGAWMGIPKAKLKIR